MSDLIVRKAMAEDFPYIPVHLPELQGLFEAPSMRELAPIPSGDSPIAESRPFPLAAASENSLCLIAEVNDQIVGLLSCRGGRYPENRHVTILEVFVSTDRRNRGIGSRLLVEALAWAQAGETVRRIQVHVPATETDTIHFFEKRGFQVEATLRDSYKTDFGFSDTVLLAIIRPFER